MKDRQQFETLLAIGAVIVFGVGFGLAWFIYPWINSTEQFAYFFGAVILVLLVSVFAFSLFFQFYIFGARRLAEGVKLIMTANPRHRVEYNGPKEMREVANTINTFADRFQALLTSQSLQIEQAHAELEEEKNRLAALISDLTEGVLVCNREGQILLYNHRARRLLEAPARPEWAEQGGGFVGLGRSVFGLLDRNVITHALETLVLRPDDPHHEDAIAHFVTTATNGQLIRARMTPVFGHEADLNGFILTLEDITELDEVSTRRDKLLLGLTEGVRSSLANIRAAIETIEDYPQMDPNNFDRLKRIIYDEALSLSSKLDHASADLAEHLRATWQLEEMMGRDLLWAVQRRFEDELTVQTEVDPNGDTVWLKVDSYSVVQALTELMRGLKGEFAIEAVSLRLQPNGRLAAFDLAWPNQPASDDKVLWAWQHQALTSDGRDLTLTDVAERHGGEVWFQSDSERQESYFRLLLPTTQPKPIVRPLQPLPYNRPEYYDFDLFNQPGQYPDFDQRPLSDLAYTVFDTETTGTNPSGGDEIISIGAVRIVNERLLRQEVFDQLVDPRRPLPPSSVEIHGISSDLLKGQPTIEQVLPQFFRFSEATVLVAHNAAFDMRLLQMKEAQTGLKFTQPVLDTLLLSAVVHPNQKNHSLEAIAERLGINVIGRHTSLGDAILTGEIFLKLLTLLFEKNIYTLGEARAAARQTYHARLRY